MSNATSPSTDEFRRSLDQLIQQAQHTAQLGLAVAREQVETLTANPNVNDQFELVRQNLQAMARDIETKAQEIVHLASTYVPTPGINPFAPPARASGAPRTEVKVEQHAAHESATAAGAGTGQSGSNYGDSTPTPNGEVPGQ